ncbi:ABC-type transport system involved in multi-copper enzyme maturation permease subunit [Paenibacillus phyllosphaerae]|uniref:ABC-type transport system involved in multi-copper enzyme maturation permease subunit n=1 Tax=Paenibacillus phyllosphaerae TaxID=274593 RepID=A0A7W5B402_9BACL|nr:ABC transporter permease [Paenibacillus phyllosphaerae]MBB3113977.1 ABC-type transport system involved in multi-copper enzyme maturation permease subunit [Paenibacillus phyllosphaerae]
MIKLIELEWRKLERKKVMGEVVIYLAILMFLPVFLLKVAFADMPEVPFGNSYAEAMGLMLPIQLGFILFGASLINHVFIEEYKNKTMALSFGYPLSRQRLVMAKTLFIALAVFACTLVSFVLAGITTYLFDLAIDVIEGTPTAADLMTYAVRMVLHAVVVALASLVPLFWFAIWKRAVIRTVICAIFLMQLPNFLGLLRITLNPDLLYAIFSLLGVISVYLSVKLVNRLGDL